MHLRRFQHPLIRRILLNYTLLTLILYILLLIRPNLISNNVFTDKKSILLVTAHPDDETLFFSPLLTTLLLSPTETPLHILVLSRGSHYGIGSTRISEMDEACKVFRTWAEDHKKGLVMGGENEGIRCEVLDVLKDDPVVRWDEEVVRKSVGAYVGRWGIGGIVTFDEGGISGHENHKSVAKALISQAKTNPESIPLYTVHTTTLLRKYTFLFDLPITTLQLLLGSSREKAIYVNGFDKWRCAVKAFGKHGSQFSWDRGLFLGLNRYMWFNTVERIV